MQTEKIAKTNSKRNLFCDGEEMEICVLCGKVTDVLKTEPLENRSGYIPGAGQLCRECAIANVQEETAAMRNGFAYSLPLYDPM